MKKGFLLVALIGLLTACSSENTSVPAEKNSPIHLTVSSEFGEKMMVNAEELTKESMDVMSLLKKHAQIKTAYGDGFVNSINQLESGYTGSGAAKKDWFYWINGIQAHVGAKEYKLGPGDQVWWDYHPWNDDRTISAVIGSFPQPFLNGYDGVYNGVKVQADSPYKQEIIPFLESYGVKVTDENTDAIQIQAGPIENWSGEEMGVPVRFKNGTLEVLNAQGKTIQSFKENAGCILAIGNGPGDPFPIWYVVGLDEASAKMAVELFKHPDKWQHRIGVVFHGQDIIPLSFP